MTEQTFSNPLGALRQFARRDPAVERCEMCAMAIPEVHEHLVDIGSRKLYCACTACGLLFSHQGAAKFKRVPRTVRWLPSFALADGQWESLLIPINMAFFFRSSHLGKVVAIYPSPAGATESELPMEAWKEIEAGNPELAVMQSDVEALLVNRLGAMRGYPEPEYYIAPIDECYALTGLIRAHWKGFSGGDDVWEKIRSFFAGLKERACPN